MSEQEDKSSSFGLLSGISYPVRGLMFVLKRPALLRLALVPLLLNVVLLAGGLGVGYYFFGELFGLIFPWEKPDSGAMVTLWWVAFYMVGTVLAVAIGGVSFLLVIAVGSIIAAPFHDLIAERTENELRGGGSEEPFSLSRIIREILTTLIDQIQLLIVFFIGLVVILLLNLVPVLGSAVSAALSFAWTWWFLTLEFTEPALSRSRYRFKQRWGLLSQHLRLAMGFGVGAWLLMFIPLTMPFLVAAGTMAACDLVPGRRDPAK